MLHALEGIGSALLASATVQIAAIVAGVALLAVLARYYKRVPPDKVLVIFGRLPDDLPHLIVTHGSRFVPPVMQSSRFLDMRPHRAQIDLDNAFTREEKPVDLEGSALFAIGKDELMIDRAVERLLDLKPQELVEMASTTIKGQLRFVLSQESVADLQIDWRDFIKQSKKHIGKELEPMGLVLLQLEISELRPIDRV